MNWKILNKYLHGACNEDELRTLGVWLQKNPANEDFFTSFIEEWGGKEKIGFDSDARVEWDKFRKNNLEPAREETNNITPSDVLGQAVKEPYSSVQKKDRQGIAYWLYTAAAVLLLLFALIFVVHQVNIPNSGQNEKLIYQEISTLKGQRTSLKLSDGTRLVLNANSTLRIPENYGKETRTLHLEGEAFFEVEHDEENPFIVISNEVFTRDLGTEFNITAYDPEQIKVAVKEGLVSMGKVENGRLQKEIVEITPNKLGVIKDVGGLTVSDIEDMDIFMGWVRGRLVFRSTPFPEVLKRLERWFNLECEIEGPKSSLVKRTLTATYNNMPMNEVLKVMSISMNVSYTRDGRKIIFSDGKS